MKVYKYSVIMFLCFAMSACHHRKETFYTYIDGGTGIGGIVDFNGDPVEGMEVYLYRSLNSNFRGPADFADTTDSAGKYFIDVPKGAYYIIARKRESGEVSGPIRAGDLYSEPVYEPVTVIDGRTAKVDLHVKRLSGALIQKKSGQEKTATSISGTLVDENGTPVKGAYAFAYKDGDLHREPDFFSMQTDDNGAFTIYFKEGGQYHLGGKDSGRGEPKEGELYGFYESPRGGSRLFIKAGEKVEDIKIIMRRRR